MRRTGKVFRPILFIVTLIAGGTIFVRGGAPAQTLNLPDSGGAYAVEDDYVPDVTARVARISFIRGEAQIRRSGADKWEKVALNLPLVEGDEIVTAAGARLEIQFDNHKHVRLAENAYFKIVNLKTEGIAVSLSRGTLNLRITSFDKEKSYFEIDAPKTTVSIERTGTYRVDAGLEGDSEVRIAAMDGGEARIYSDNAGLTLKNGRRARIFIDGPASGEWETAAAARLIDEFDEWASDRDAVIAKRLKDAYYDKYYDQDIYGADDLNDYGEWVHTRNYGYVWRPYRTSISRYVDWSPYRYGHWRWMPPYGWIWVNDEPWGWATYHHGRWVYDNGYWSWSPYGYYRTTRSWWFPALVVINIFNNNVCWYPLPYHHAFYNYNWHHNNNHQAATYVTGGVKPIPTGTPTVYATGGGKPIPTPDPTIIPSDQQKAKVRPNGGIKSFPIDIVPPDGVVIVGSDDFGTKIRGIRTAPLGVANAVLSIKPDDAKARALPAYSALNGKIGGDIISDSPRMDTPIKLTGAAPRRKDTRMDDELRTTRVSGGRPPLVVGNDPVNTGAREPRKTGAVARPTIVRSSDFEAPVKQSPVYEPPAKVTDEPRNTQIKVPRYDQPPARQEPPPARQQPRYDPPPRERPRSDPAPAPVKPPTKSEPPPVKQPPAVKADPKPQPKEDRKEVGDGEEELVSDLKERRHLAG